VISLIVAASENGVIGKDGVVPWHLPSELIYFKQTTIGHPVIMGRKTHGSIGRALPGRTNIVITRQKNYRTKNCVVVHSIDEAISQAQKASGSDEIFIIGGAEIYELAMPLAQRLYLTNVHAKIEGDKFFEHDPKDWNEISRKTYPTDKTNKYGYDVLVLEKI